MQGATDFSTEESNADTLRAKNVVPNKATTSSTASGDLSSLFHDPTTTTAKQTGVPKTVTISPDVVEDKIQIQPSTKKRSSHGISSSTTTNKNKSP